MIFVVVMFLVNVFIEVMWNQNMYYLICLNNMPASDICFFCANYVTYIYIYLYSWLATSLD